MAFGQLPVPVEPEDLLMAQTMPGAPPSQPQQPYQPVPQQQVPMQVGGTTALVNPVTGEMTAPNITTTTNKDPSWSTTKTPETAKMAEAQATAAETRAMAEDAAKKQAMAKVQEETFRAEAADRENEILRQQIAEREATLKDQDARVSASLTELRQRQAEQANMKPQTYVENMGTLRHALSAIGVALGAYAATKGGGPNTAFEIFKAGEQAHREKQKALIDQKAAQIEQATGNVRAAMDFKNKALAAVDEKYLLKNKFMQSMIEAKIKRIPTAAASGQAELAKLRKDYDATEMDVAQKLAGTRTDQGPEKSTTEVEGKPAAGGTQQTTQFDKTLALHGNIMDRAIDEMEKSKPPSKEALAKAQDNQALMLAAVNEAKTTGGAIKQILLRKFELAPRYSGEGVSAQDQIYLNNANRVNTSFLRITSGAAIKDDEFIRMADELLISPGESPEVSAWKLRQMRAIAKDVGALSGKVGKELNAANAAQESPPRPAPTGQTPAQKKYTETTAKQIEQDKRDFAQERKDIAAADKLLKSKDLDQNERDALEWARKNPLDPRAVETRRRVLQKKGGK